jgi:hypothetical protein
MIQYYLAMDLEIHDTDFSLKEVEIGQKALDENGGSEKALSDALDAYIKENDWTGYLGTFGSGNRERGFAVEGFFEACGRSFTYNELEESTKIKENEEESPWFWLAYNNSTHSYEILQDPPKTNDYASYCEFERKYLDKIIELFPKLNSIANKSVEIWNVVESNPFSDRSSSNWFFSEDEANDYYNELCGNQGGRSSYDDDEGGMDYSIDEIEQPFKKVLYELSQDMTNEELIRYIELFDRDELTERALEIGDGKVYAVQDAFYTRKTHDATGKKDIIVKNGNRDPSLTNIEKDVAKKSIEVLKKMGRLGDVSKEYNVDHGPDLTYIPVEDTVKVTPDDGSKPYKIKIPEALSFLKPYEYDILDEAVAVYTKVDECKKALQESFSAIETINSINNKNFGYLENEVTIFKIK